MSHFGITILRTWVNQSKRNTRLTLIKSLLTPATPTAVLIMVGHMEQRVTVSMEIMNDLENIGSSLTYTELTTKVMSGNHASGDTGLKI